MLSDTETEVTILRTIDPEVSDSPNTLLTHSQRTGTALPPLPHALDVVGAAQDLQPPDVWWPAGVLHI
jgi:hypothetical protein